MFSPDVAARLRTAGHDALHGFDLSLGGAEDTTVLGAAIVEQRVLVTENAVDFVPSLEARLAVEQSATAVVIVLKRTLPREAGALAHHLTERLCRWADLHPQPYQHVHWPG